MKRKNTQTDKFCPLADQNCLKDECSLYNELLDNCEIAVLSYNLYRYSNSMKPNDEK